MNYSSGYLEPDSNSKARTCGILVMQTSSGFTAFVIFPRK